MKKRFISIALCMLMLVTAVLSTACAKEEEDPAGTLTIEGGTTAKPMTISIWGIKEKSTTDKAIAEVEAAMNKISQAKFNTAIELVLVEEDEYEEKLSDYVDNIQAEIDRLAAEEAERKRIEKENRIHGLIDVDEVTEETTASAEETEEYEEETVVDEDGLTVTVYPEVGKDQLDIFLITDYEMLEKFHEKDILSSLDEELNTSSRLISSYIHPTLLSAGKMNGSTVAIVNQQTVGAYTYMLVNKELVKKYNWDVDSFTCLYDAYFFIRDVDRSEPDYIPFVGDASPLNVEYFSPNGVQTVYGAMLPADAQYGDSFAPMELLRNTRYANHIKAQFMLEYHDCIGGETFTAEDKFGVAIMKGKSEDVDPFRDDYHVITLQVPQGTADNLYNGMFAISTYTKDLTRSMEILTYLNTNEQFRDLFGYGVEGVHYKVNDIGGITKLNNDYNMKLEYTGNCFLTYPANGQPKSYWDTYKKHNEELVLSPYFQFYVTEEDLDMDIFALAVDYTTSVFDALAECTTLEELEDEINTKLIYSRKGDLKYWLQDSPKKTDADGNPIELKTLGTHYKDWKESKQ